jgi:predicted transcriptional regulator
MKTVIISLHEKWWKKILSGDKTLEIRKSKPAAAEPFRVLVYITGTGCIHGMFHCPEVMEIKSYEGITKESKVSFDRLNEYGKGKTLAGWKVTEATEFYTPHPISLYGIKRPPQTWCYYKGKEVPDFTTINNLANRCGYFYNANFDTEASCTPNNGYNCKHPEQEESYNGVGCCYQWSCPLKNITPADEEDCKKYGMEYEENEFVMVYRWEERKCTNT